MNWDTYLATKVKIFEGKELAEAVLQQAVNEAVIVKFCLQKIMIINHCLFTTLGSVWW